MSHWAQGVRGNDQFRDYDWTALINLIKYGSFTPPRFELENARAPPMAVFFGGRDTLASIVDVNMIMNGEEERRAKTTIQKCF